MPGLMRTCGRCGQTDDHPRHVFALGGAEEVARHMDCCAAVGCEICADQIAGAAGAKGDDLRTHIVTKDATDAVRES